MLWGPRTIPEPPGATCPALGCQPDGVSGSHSSSSSAAESPRADLIGTTSDDGGGEEGDGDRVSSAPVRSPGAHR